MVGTVKLHHIDIIIPKNQDQKARDYYCQLLGFKEIEKPQVLRKNGGMWLEIDNSQLHLSYEKKEGYDPRKTKSHLAFQVKDLDQFKNKLEENGHRVKSQGQIPGMIRFETEDPFGHRLEFLQIIEEGKND